MNCNTSAKKRYIIAVCWLVLSLGSSVLNDVLTKCIINSLHILQIGFFRFLFSSIALLPLIIYYGPRCIHTRNIFIHIIRGVILFCGIITWIYGLSVVQLTTATVINFSMPLFTLILGAIILKEHVTWQRYVATIVGFGGIVVTLSPELADFNIYSLVFFISAFLFALLDIINKAFVRSETMMSMMFYSAIVTAVLSLPSALHTWQDITLMEIGILITIGINANLLLFFLLKAFALAEATALAPYRYIELLISICVQYMVFADMPLTTTIYGACILIPCTLFITYSEEKRISDIP